MTAFPVLLFADIMRCALFQPATNLWRAVELEQLIRRGFPFLTEKADILDLGCGDGEIMKLLRPYLPEGSVLTGIDIDTKEVELAKESGAYDRVLCSEGRTIPLPDASQDAIISNSVLEHIEPIQQTLKEVSRLLKEGGLFLATVPAPDFHVCLSGPFWQWSSRERYLQDVDQRLAHLRYWTPEEWSRNLDEAGLTLVDAFSYLDARAVRRWETLSRWTGGLLFYLMGKKKVPIILQRDLGLRRRRKCSEFLARFLARVLSFGLDGTPLAPFGCLLLVGRKKRCG